MTAPTVRIGIAQLNPCVGAIDANSAAIHAAYDTLRTAGAQLVVTGELAVCGYPPEDLLERREFIADCDSAVAKLAANTDTTALLVGAPRRIDGAHHIDAAARTLTNTAYAAAGGQIVGHADKTLLANHDIFDEARHFHPGAAPSPILMRWDDQTVSVGVLICEDLWGTGQSNGTRPVADQLVGAGADILIAVNASPHWAAKQQERHRVAAAVVERCRVPLVYVNSWGAQDGTVFDGASFALDADGELIFEAASFADTVAVVDVALTGRRRADNGRARAQKPTPPVRTSATRDDHWAQQTWAALRVGVADYVTKGGHRHAVIGLSGGIDSAVTAAVAVDALGPENVRGVAIPGPYSSNASLRDAQELAERLGIRFDVVDIGPMYSASIDALYHTGPLDGPPSGVTPENLQARLRGLTLMALTNAGGGIVLSTGNKSELSVGYSTLYGDMVGGLAVISDIAKTDVYRLARWRNRIDPAGGPIPENTIERAPSAELAADQRDDDTLPPYDILDPILAAYIEQRRDPADIIADGWDPDTVTTVVGLVDRCEYKRRQAAPGIKVTAKAFGAGRRMPITNRYPDRTPPGPTR